MHKWLAFIFVALTGAAARADDAARPPPAPPPAAPAAPVAEPAPPPTPEQAADAVLAAVKAKDDATLKALAAKDEPDPWLVADELIHRGEFGVADAFAKAAPRVDIDRLPEYVASRRGQADDAAARKSLAAANAALAAAKAIDALEALGPSDAAPPADVVGIRRAFGRGLAFSELGRLEESAKAFLVASAAAEHAGWRARAFRALREAGMSAARRSDYSGALSAWERCRGIAEARGDRAAVAATLGNIGNVHQFLGDFPKAFEVQALALKMKEDLGDRDGVAATLVNIGNVHYAVGNHPKALEYYERGLEEAVAIGQRQWAANALGGLGLVHDLLGDHAKALGYFERALKMNEDLADRAGVARTLDNLSSVHQWLGNLPKALEYEERALKMSEDLGDAAGVARARLGIGTIHSSLGNYARALEDFEQALRVKEGLGDRAGVARTLGNLGAVHQSLGSLAKALEYEERALKMKEDLGDAAGVALTLGNLGNVHYSLGNYAKALEIQERALKMKQDLGDRAGVALTLGNIGSAHQALGNYPKALEVQERALKLSEDLGDRASAALTLCNIGIVYGSLGHHAKALEYEGRAVALARDVGDRDVLVRGLWHLAACHLALAAWGEAIHWSREAVEEMSGLIAGLADEQGAGAREQFSEVYAIGARAAAGLGAAGDVSYFLESGRAGALLESLKGRDALRAALPEGLRIAEAEARGRESRAVAAYRKSRDGIDRTRIQTLRAELERAQDGVREVVERFQREAKSAASVFYPKADTLAEIQKRLGSEEAIVSFGLFPERAIALVMTMKEVRIVALPPAIEIEAAVDQLQVDERESSTAAALAALRKAVVEPLALGKDVRRVLVSPDGALSYVPFAALFEGSGIDVAYEPSGTTYGVLREDAAKTGEGVLALGDPDYQTKVDERALAVVRGGLRLAQLPGTRDEVNALGTKVLLGADASEAGFRDAVVKRPRWRAVHFACHGLVDPERPAFSSLALSASGDDDGFLTALDVFRMKIPADLVVLSACETGKGKIVRGEGIVGLTRAFMFAGAPRVICSLWKVDDDATRALMVRFYELWNPKDGKAGLPTAKALRKAQEFVRDDPAHPKWKHPYYWAAWVLWGLPE